MKNIMDAFLNKNLELRLRILLIWKSIFICRIWRNWILNTKDYTLKTYFMTSAAYHCLEINGHEFLKIVRKMRDNLTLD